MTVTIDSHERTAEAFHIVDGLTAEQELVTSAMLPAMRAMSAEQTVQWRHHGTA